MKEKIKNALYPLRRLHGRLHEWAVERKQLSKLCHQIRAAGKYGVLVFATPTHTNLGDSAIVLAETEFLRRYITKPYCLIEITSGEYLLHEKRIARCIHPDSLICWHGGGNMGDQWFGEEKLRRESVVRFAGNPVVVFPQTVHYTDTETGRREEAASVSVYNGKENLVLVAREKESYAQMRRLYSETEVLLVPDIVLSATAETFGVAFQQKRCGALLCMRNDAERAVSDGFVKQIETQLGEYGLSYRYTDTHSSGWLSKETRMAAVRKKLEEFTGAKLVITDRLHGMVFAAITGTPCIAMGNYNHKVRGTYEWIKYLPYIRYVKTAAEAQLVLPELLALGNCRYDNGPLQPYFEELARVVKRYAEN